MSKYRMTHQDLGSIDCDDMGSWFIFFEEGEDELVEVCACSDEQWARRVLCALRWMESCEDGVMISEPFTLVGRKASKSKQAGKQLKEKE